MTDNPALHYEPIALSSESTVVAEFVADPATQESYQSEADLERFGSALTAVQAITGGWFAPVQGGTFTPGASAELVRGMAQWGAAGVGQSSWGPAVYGIVEGDEAARRLADRVRGAMGPAGKVYEGPFRTEGARVWREPVSAQAPATVSSGQLRSTP